MWRAKSLEKTLMLGRLKAEGEGKGWFVIQSLSRVQLFASPWTAAHQASLSFTISWSLLKLMSIELIMPSNHLILCHPLLFLPLVFSFPMSWLFSSGGPSLGVSASASVLPMNIQGWFPLGLTGLISWLSKGLSWVFVSTIIQKYHQRNCWLLLKTVKC